MQFQLKLYCKLHPTTENQSVAHRLCGCVSQVRVSPSGTHIKTYIATQLHYFLMCFLTATVKVNDCQIFVPPEHTDAHLNKLQCRCEFSPSQQIQYECPHTSLCKENLTHSIICSNSPLQKTDRLTLVSWHRWKELKTRTVATATIASLIYPWPLLILTHQLCRQAGLKGFQVT